MKIQLGGTPLGGTPQTSIVGLGLWAVTLSLRQAQTDKNRRVFYKCHPERGAAQRSRRASIVYRLNWRVLFLTLLISQLSYLISTPQAVAQVSGQYPATIYAPNGATNIQWYKDGAVIAGQTASTYSVTASGAYYAKYDDPNACNGRSTQTINMTPTPSADLGVSITPLTLTSNVGETQAYIITVVNNGPDTAPNATIKVPIPSGRTYLAGQASQGAYDSGTQIWTVGSMANGATVTMTLSIRVD